MGNKTSILVKFYQSQKRKYWNLSRRLVITIIFLLGNHNAFVFAEINL